MINDKLCQAMADAVTFPPTTAEATQQVHEHFLTIGQEWSASQDIPDSVCAALLRPDTLSLSELDRAATRLRHYIREMPMLQSRLASVSLLLTLLGGIESRQLAGRCYVAALYPPAIGCVDSASQAASTLQGPEFRFAGSGSVAPVSGEDDRIDERVITACELAWNAYDAYWSAENALLDMPQDDTHFIFGCERADALQREWRALFGCVCEMSALTPAGRFAKARLASYLTNTEPVGPVQDDGLLRLHNSMSRDLDRANRHGWLPSG